MQLFSPSRNSLIFITTEFNHVDLSKLVSVQNHFIVVIGIRNNFALITTTKSQSFQRAFRKHLIDNLKIPTLFTLDHITSITLTLNSGVRRTHLASHFVVKNPEELLACVITLVPNKTELLQYSTRWKLFLEKIYLKKLVFLRVASNEENQIFWKSSLFLAGRLSSFLTIESKLHTSDVKSRWALLIQF